MNLLDVLTKNIEGKIYVSLQSGNFYKMEDDVLWINKGRCYVPSRLEANDLRRCKVKEVCKDFKDEIKIGETFYFITVKGNIAKLTWHNEAGENMIANYSGIYRTEEEAIKVKESIVELVKEIKQNN